MRCVRRADGGRFGVAAVRVRRTRLGGVAPMRDLVGPLVAAVGGGVGLALLAALGIAIHDELDAVPVRALQDVLEEVRDDVQ